jgi:hypothetical protein
MGTDAADAGGRLGALGTITGICCISGLLLFMFRLATSGGWFLMHDSPRMFLLGVCSLWLAPAWLLCAGAATVSRRERPLRRIDVALLLGVPLMAVFTLVALRS